VSQIRLGSFTPSVLLDVARTAGRLADLDVVETPVPSSPAQFASLDAGELDAVFTSPDNGIAYRYLRRNPLGRLLDVEFVAGIDRGLGLTLGLRSGLDTPTPGIRFGVDVPNSGFAFVGYALLSRAGLQPGDYEVVTLGSTPKRVAALLAGECDITILGAGNDLRARAGGATIVGSSADLGPYLGTVLARLGESGASADVHRLGVVLTETARDIVGGELADAAARSAELVLGLSPKLARDHVAIMADARVGLVPDGSVDLPSLRTLVELRRRFLPDPDLDAVELSPLLR